MREPADSRHVTNSYHQISSLCIYKFFWRDLCASCVVHSTQSNITVEWVLCLRRTGVFTVCPSAPSGRSLSIMCVTLCKGGNWGKGHMTGMLCMGVSWLYSKTRRLLPACWDDNGSLRMARNTLACKQSERGHTKRVQTYFRSVDNRGNDWELETIRYLKINDKCASFIGIALDCLNYVFFF